MGESAAGLHWCFADDSADEVQPVKAGYSGYTLYH